MGKKFKDMSIGQRIFRIAAGYEIAVACLSLLFLLTFFGTIEQRWFGLWTTIHKYFDYNSVWVQPMNADQKLIFFPLPGAYWVIVVLSVNMFLGGIIRARKGWKKAGVLVSHFAILFMLVAGAVSSLYKEEGNMRVLQGERSDYAQKLFKHDIEVFTYDEKGDREAPAIVRSKHINALGKDDQLEATFEKFDFKMEIDRYLPYSELALDSPTSRPPNGEEVVDGFFLVEVDKDVKTEERNTPGCYVSIKDENDGVIQRLVLWAGNPYPVTFNYEGKRYGVTYLMEIWPMPFEVELHKTFGENHPGTEIPRWFQSDITKVDGSDRTEYEIVMNEPARHGGYTLYQAGFTRAAEGETPSSTFAVVNNPSDKWPEYALWASAAGLLFHFMFMLIRFIDGGSKSGKAPKPVANQSPKIPTL
ncbi:MAG: cytochrome c biogenesis protein ResB [Akkermansiaceae bacterium]